MAKTHNDIRIYHLVNMDKPEAVFDEVRHLCRLVSGDCRLPRLARTFADTVRLFEGRYPGYRACNTDYHDLKHTTDALLSLARLIHGAAQSGLNFPEAQVELALIAALLHDSGYIQTSDDALGTGAKYTQTHEARSIAFLQSYAATIGLSAAEQADCRDIIRCTDLSEDLAAIDFSCEEIAVLGKMMATADLAGQIADRTYLEKLLFLFREFHEGQVRSYSDEFDLLTKTVGFYEYAKHRLEQDLDDLKRFMRPHFQARWCIDRDLYQEATQRNIAFLDYLLANHPHDYRQLLRRNGLVDKLIEQEQAAGDWPVLAGN